ncbi:Uncharacterised protein [uncultured archaeon]|nr:Uncharacterised protein [uncultured archaeon]
MLMIVSWVISTGPAGMVLTTARLRLLLIISTRSISPFTTALPSSTRSKYCGPPMSLIWRVGATTIFLAGLARARQTCTFASIPTTRFDLVFPSILMISWGSSGFPGQAIA